MTQLLDRLDDRFELLAGGDRLAAGRHRSLAAAVAWSYRLLDDNEQRVFRAMSVFPGPFTLAAAEAVAGKNAGQAVLRLVECSLLGSPVVGPDGRARYRMLETLRAYGGRLLAEAGERDDTAAVLAAHALQVAEEAAAGLLTSPGKLAAAHWLDAEDAIMREVLAWATEHDTDLALRLAVALAPWWWLRGRLAGGSLTAWAALATLQRHEEFTDATPGERGLAKRSRGPAAVGECPGTPGRRTRRRDEARHRCRVGLHAHHAQPAAIPRAAGPGEPASGNESWSPWSPRDVPTPRSLRGCTSACALSVPTWTVSGTRPAAVAGLTSPGSPWSQDSCSRPAGTV